MLLHATIAIVSAVGAAALLFGIDAATGDPLRVFDAAGRTVIVDAGTRSVSFDGATLTDAGGVVGAVEHRGRLLVAQRDGVVLVYDLPNPGEDGIPVLTQRVEQLGRGVCDIVAVPEADRVLVLAAGSTEVFGLRFFDQELLDGGEVDQPAYVGHSRYFEFLRDDEGKVDPAKLFALGPQTLALVTDTQIIELFHLDRSYRVLSRAAIPDGVARIESLVFTGSRWILAGLDSRAEPVLMSAEKTTESWADFGIKALDAALEIDHEPIAWLPGKFTLTDTHVALAIRGERGAVAKWPRSAERLTKGYLGIELFN